MAASEKVAMENINKPGRVVNVDADKYHAVRDAVLAALPSNPPGLTLVELRQAIAPLAPEALFPGQDKLGWWMMGVQLDLRAKGLVATEKGRPQRLYRT